MPEGKSCKEANVVGVPPAIDIFITVDSRASVRHGSFSSPADLNAAVLGFVRQWNDIERRPFRWRFRGEFAPRLPWAA